MRFVTIAVICIAIFNILAVIYHNYSNKVIITYLNQPQFPTSNPAPTHFLPYRSDFVSFENPFRYKNRVDLRVIVLTMNRFEFLRDLLDSLKSLEMEGDTLSVEIWIDRDRKDNLDEQTLNLSLEFSKSNDYTSIHVHPVHAGLYNQWISTYSSSHLNPGEEEIVLFLEDDLQISRKSYKWLKAVHKRFSNESDYVGCTLRLLDSVHPMKAVVPLNNSVFMHRFYSTHAFSPKLEVWKEFQRWFPVHVDRKSFKPYVLDIKPTEWYKNFEKQNRTDTMWSIWMLHFIYIEQLFSVYVNPGVFLKVPASNKDLQKCFCIDRQAKGLHFLVNSKKPSCELVEEWDDSFINFPDEVMKVDWNGSNFTVT